MTIVLPAWTRVIHWAGRTASQVERNPNDTFPGGAHRERQ